MPALSTLPTPPQFALDLRGRLKNLRLPPSRALVPVLEALMNGLHAVEAGGANRGSVKIEVLRENPQLALEGMARGPIVGFRVVDDGIGFSDENLESFRTSDSTFKAKIGGRGVGRFTWLKAFEHVQIESTFRRGDRLAQRRFRFSPDGITDFIEQGADDARATGTVVTLGGLLPEFQAHIPKKAPTLGQRVVEHCFMAVRACSTKRLSLSLIDGEDEVDLSQLVAEDFKNAEKDSFKLDKQQFRVTHLRIRSPEVSSHRLAFLANRREVRSEPLSRAIPQLRQRLTSEDGGEFWWLSLVESEYLDSQVSPERDSFLFADEADPLFPDEPSLGKIRDAATKLAAERLEPLLAPIRERSVERVTSFVATTAPEYKHLLRLRPDAIQAIPPDLSDEKLDLELHKVSYTVEASLRAQGHELLKSEKLDVVKYDHFLSEANALGKANLAKYVVHRRTILDLFKRSLGLNTKGSYELEEAVHRHIFPLKATSDDVPFEQSNLWIIDERLSYHAYLASDKAFGAMDVVTVDGRERPDLITFGNPFAFSDDQAPNFGSIVIIEFKRPARDDFNDVGNPIAQVLGYVRKLRSGSSKDRDGRPISLPESTPFYCYVICDLTDTMREQAQNAGLTPSPDAQGFFGFNPSVRAYLEVISFAKLLGDAIKRNRVMFDKLNLPKG
jgi:hypothetical protein